MGSRLTRAAILLAIPAAGCTASPKDRLQGKWVGERVDSFRSDQAKRAEGWAGATMLEFDGSRVTVTIPAESPRQGTFTIARASKDEVAVQFLRPHGSHDLVTFRWEGDDHLRWLLGDGRSVLMKKVD